jgi:hypothetical protein
MRCEPKIFILTIISFIILCAAYQAPAQENTGGSDKVAVVNGTIISQEQFNREMIPVQEVIDASGKSLSATDMEIVKKTVLEKIIKNELLYQECQKNNVLINDTEIDKKFEATKSQFASDAEFQERLTQLNTNEELYKSQIKKELAIQRLINQKFKPTITDKEIKAYYESNPDKFKKGDGTIGFEEAKEDIRKTIGKEKIADSYNNFYTEVRDKAKVDIYIEQ